MNQKIESKLEYLRLITPILVTIGIFLMANINTQLGDINQKLFKHLTNDEMHCPRSITVMKPEFLIYQSMRDKQMDQLSMGIVRIENLIEKHMERSEKK